MTKRTDVDVPTPDGKCPSILITPHGEGSWPAVIMFMDAGGVRPAMIEMAEKLAGMGYVCLLPEMYYRHGGYEPFDISTAFTDPEERTRLGVLAGGLTKAMVASDTGAFLEFLSQRPGVAGQKVGTTGICMGGGLSLLEAALTDGGVDHTVEIYPALHGFAVPNNPTYDAHIAARHWQALSDLYRTTLEV